MSHCTRYLGLDVRAENRLQAVAEWREYPLRARMPGGVADVPGDLAGLLDRVS